MSSSVETARVRPYVGPRPFTRTDIQVGRDLYGRDTEVESLFNLLISERIVLLYSPSGAGKTSMIEAKLVPRLQAEGLTVLPTARVGMPLSGPANGANRYLVSTLSALGADQPQDVDSLDAFLGHRRSTEREPQVLILDQFEEVLIEDPTDRMAKEAFFRQLGAALRDRNRWVLFSMREDYVAGMDLYARFVSTRFSARFRLDLLSQQAATAAIVEPARRVGVDFVVAHQLVRELSMTRVQRADGALERQAGLYVEPVQLQVVCVRIWEQLAPGATQVTDSDVQAVGDVDDALAGYYADSLAAISSQQHVAERQIRQWIGEHLITPEGVRGQVLQEVEQTEGMPNHAIQALIDAHLLRAERRRGLTWFELAHDRLVQPVQRDNSRWFADHLSELQRKAALWSREGRSSALLLRGHQLVEAERWARDHPDQLADVERVFLTAALAERRAEQSERLKNRAILALAIIASGLVVLSFFAFVTEQNSRARADAQAQLAQSRELAADAGASLSVDPALAGVLALEAARHATTAQADEALRQVIVGMHETARLPHDNAVLAVAFSPDGAYLATGGLNGVAGLWDARSGARVADLRSGSAQVGSVTFSSSGELLATASDDGTVRLWDGRTGAPSAALNGRHSGTVTDVAFSPDGAVLASTGKDGTARLWNVQSGEPIGDVLQHKSLQYPLQRVVFNHAGTRLLTASWDNEAWVWDPRNGRLVTKLVGHTQAVWSAAFSPDDTRIVTGSWDATVRVWDASSGKQLFNLGNLGDRVLSVAFSPDGRLIATGTGNLEHPSGRDRARTWDATTGALVQELQGHTSAIVAAAFNPDSSRLLTASYDKTARIWDSRSGQLVATLVGHTERILAAALSTDGRSVITASADGTARIWSVGSEARFVNWSAAAPVMGVAFNSTGTQILTAEEDGTAHIWSAETGLPIEAGPSPRRSDPVSMALLSPDGRRVLTTGWDGSVHLDDLQPARTRELDRHPAPVLAGAWSADGAFVATASADRSVDIWDTATGAALATRSDDTAGVLATAFRPDGATLVTAAGDGTVRRWTWGTGQSQVVLTLPVPVASVAFSADASRLIEGDSTGHARVWDAATGQQLVELSGSMLPVTAVSLSQNGAYAATGTGGIQTSGLQGNVTSIWEVASGQVAARLPMDPGIVTGVAFSPDGEQVVTTSADRSATVRLYNWRLYQTIDGLEARVQTLVERVHRQLSPEERREYLHEGSGG